jgi:hypothetical protein
MLNHQAVEDGPLRVPGFAGAEINLKRRSDHLSRSPPDGFSAPSRPGSDEQLDQLQRPLLPGYTVAHPVAGAGPFDPLQIIEVPLVVA